MIGYDGDTIIVLVPEAHHSAREFWRVPLSLFILDGGSVRKRHTYSQLDAPMFPHLEAIHFAKVGVSGFILYPGHRE
jgi:hypothetical protein